MSHMAGRIWGREPVVILSAVQSVIALAMGFGLPITSEQMALILTVTGSLLALFARSQVTAPRVTMGDRMSDDE